MMLYMLDKMSMFSRYVVSELLVISRGVTFSGLYQGTNNVQGVRSLYSAAALGVDNYVKSREHISRKLMNMTESFRSKMTEFSDPTSKHMIFTEDLKNMLYLTDPAKGDMDVVVNMIKKFHQQTKEQRFGTYTFGPVVMRMLYFLDEPTLALDMFKNTELQGFFDQLVSYQLLMDLLLKHEMYKDVLDVLEIVKKKPSIDGKYPKNAILLGMAACYKLNTADSFKYALDLWKELLEIGHVPLRRTTTFAVALALNHNSPHIALEILSTVPQANYVTVRNLKVAALADIGRPEDALPILRMVLGKDDPTDRKHTFNKDAIEKLKTAFALTANDNYTREFEELCKGLGENGNITDTTIDDLLSAEIVALPYADKDRSRKLTDASFSRQKTTGYKRPGLRDLY